MKCLLVALLVVFAPVLSYTQTKIIKAELKYLYTLVNKDEMMKKEYLFAKPDEIKFDSKNNVYVNDYNGTEIRKYSKTGKYIAAIGRAGDGPGEFRTIVSYDIKNDKLLIYGSADRLTEYTAGNKMMRTITSVYCSMYQLWLYPDNKILSKKFDDNTAEKNIFHIYNNNMKEEITSFGHPSVFFDIKNPVYLHERSMLNVLVLENGDVFVNKCYYDGKLYKFDSKSNWKHTVFNRPEYKYKSYRFLTTASLNDFNLNKRMFQEDRTNKQVGVVIYTVSAGLVLYDNKYILNFVIQKLNNTQGAEDKSELGLEVFEKSGKYIGYCKIDETNNIDKNINTKVFIDNENSIYMREWDFSKKGGSIKVKKYKLSIEII